MSYKTKDFISELLGSQSLQTVARFKDSCERGNLESAEMRLDGNFKLMGMSCEIVVKHEAPQFCKECGK